MIWQFYMIRYMFIYLKKLNNQFLGFLLHISSRFHSSRTTSEGSADWPLHDHIDSHAAATRNVDDVLETIHSA